MPRKLNLTPDFSDYQIFGLSTHLKDYKLCWHINSALQTNFIRHEGLPVDVDPPRKYSLFEQKEFCEQLDLYLLSNFSNHIPWFEKAKHFHYFFIISGRPLKSQFVFFEKSLKKIPQMLMVTKLSSQEKKLAQPLLSNFELHLTETAIRNREESNIVVPKRAGIKKLK